MPYPFDSLPNTSHSVFYSYAITLPGQAEGIGSFEKFSVSFTRAHERIREVLFKRGAQTNEIVWSTTDIQVSIDHVELYNTSMLQALGFQIYTIEELNTTLDIQEYMYIPSAPGSPTEAPTANSSHRMITYKDCVATSASKDVSTGTARIVESMTFECRTVIGSGLPAIEGLLS
jgi:hypothetical protein